MASCDDEQNDSSATNFQKVPSKTSGILFSNNIVENDTLNYFNFPYLYLGGGVSIGDINNDGLPDIYFTGNLVPNKLYLNKGNLQFEDISQKAGVSGDTRWYTGSTMADVNNDGFLDIYVNVSQFASNGENQLFINNGDNTFTEKASAYGINDNSTSIQSTFFDYDNDGYLDLFVANYPIVEVSMGNAYYYDKMDINTMEDSGHLYRNNGNETFTNVTDSAGLRNFGMTLGLIAQDFNNDNFKDLYLSNDFNVPDYLYQNNGDGTFTEIAEEALSHTSMFGMGIDSRDFNNDGLMDIMQVDMTAEDHKRSKTNMASMRPETFYEAVDLGFNYQYMQNSLQMNNGVNSEGVPVFSDISRFAGMATTDWSWGTVFADFDNDGFSDVFVSNGVKRDVNNNDVLVKYDSRSPFGKQEKRDYRLMPSTPISNYSFRNNGDNTFSKTTKEWGLDAKGFSNGFAAADLDNDGDLDLVINNLDSEASIYANSTNTVNAGYLKVKLDAGPKNPFGLGAKVTLNTDVGKQTQELTLTRGYQSSTEPILHFGLGSSTTIEEITIVWPNGKSQTLKDISSNQKIVIKIDSTEFTKNEFSKAESRFTDISQLSGINFIHKEDYYDDYRIEPLLPHKNSQLGPGLAVGDVNQDGLDDFFIGNAAKSAARLYIQDLTGGFTIMKGPWETDSQFEDTGALFFDADTDGDLDLYIVNGGNNKRAHQTHYQDRLYINTNEGFIKSEKSLPEITSSGLKVVSADYDKDGDLDLFVGGRIVPGNYPYPPQSYILRNDGGKDLEVHFTDVTQELAPELSNAGLITSALWDDFDADGNIDLIVSGEWMPIRFFKNTGNAFEEVTEKMGFEESRGWWYDLQKVDIDADGDLDYLAGNLGLNYKYKTSKSSPFEIYANDFDENGTSDIVLSYEKQGVKLPLRGRECSSQQVPAIKKRFETFESFANADLNDIYGKSILEKSLKYRVDTFAHHWIENKGNGSFEMHELPNHTQFSSISAFEIFDYNGDQYPDVISGGNLLQSEVETPRNDAGVGLVLSGSATGWNVVKPKKSNLFINGEVKDITTIRLGTSNKVGFLIALNNNQLRLLKLR
ncbi:hypothetical protein FEE95_03030 [Maribacter algarum]|uniref:ASPIC/UnbV domain-containing protein n=2 Tax=Maribacter algarum (ex Zhang et al. 2020) TaxID=2578118 RepID=A0A5S3QNT8_9FLAO|nr:hypothetical protein FEE95_03030 [Maribacter algarum]